MTTAFKCEIQDNCISTLTRCLQVQHNELLYSAYLEGQRETTEQTREKERQSN